MRLRLGEDPEFFDESFLEEVSSLECSSVATSLIAERLQIVHR